MKDIFQFHHDVIDRYKEFSEGFAKIASQDIREYADQIFREENKYTPPPLIQLNMNYSPGMTIEQMVADGSLHPLCKDIFRIKGNSEFPPALAPAAGHHACLQATELRSHHGYRVR